MNKDKKKQKLRQKQTAKLPLQAPKWWQDRTLLMYLGILVIAVLTTFSPAFNNGFVNWDDDVNVYDNPNIDSLTATSVRAIFTTSVIGGYNPLPILTFAVEKHFFGLDPFIYHFDNILLHLINTILVFFLGHRLGLKRPAALVLALLFGIQPMRVESVAWVTERKDVLFGFFTLSAMLCYTIWLNRKKRVYLLWTYILFIISVFAKIQAVVLPLSLLVIDYFLNRPLKLRLVLEKIPMFLISLGGGLLGIWFLSRQQMLDTLSYGFFEKILIASYSLMIYIIKSVVPYQMAVIYPFPKTGEFPWVFYFSLAFLAILIGMVLLTLKRTRVLAFGLLFFLFNIMFLLQFVTAGQGFIADRFGYIGYFGLFFIYAWFFGWLLENRTGWRPATWGMAVVLLFILGVVSHNRVYAWKDPETLWTDQISKYKNVAVAYNNRGKYYREQKETGKALADYNELLRVAPDDFNGFNSRGKLYFDEGRTELALKDFNRSIELNPRFAKAYSNRGAIHGMMKNYQLAINDFDKALELKPDEVVTYTNRALAYMELGKFEEAAGDCDRYLLSKPGDSEVWDLRAVCSMNLKKFAEALQYSDKAIGLNPSQATFYLNRCYIYFSLGDRQKARADADQAEKLGAKVNPALLTALNK
jgi:protein O-mannosyl-transferase